MSRVTQGYFVLPEFYYFFHFAKRPETTEVEASDALRRQCSGGKAHMY